ncbi:hypothetical protein GCM10027081_06300 [Cupriavidus yeoncheonensis]
MLQQLVALVDLLLGKPAFLQDEQVDHPRDSLLLMLIATKNKDKREDKRRQARRIPGGPDRFSAESRASVIALRGRRKGRRAQGDGVCLGWLASREREDPQWHGARFGGRRRYGKTLARMDSAGDATRRERVAAPAVRLRSPQ